MLAAESYDNSLNVHESVMSEIHRSKISLHRAKTGYDYPTIRLPHTFLRLVGLSTRIYQTVQEGALAFLVVLSSTEVPRKVPNRPSCRAISCISWIFFSEMSGGRRLSPQPAVPLSALIQGLSFSVAAKTEYPIEGAGF